MSVSSIQAVRFINPVCGSRGGKTYTDAHRRAYEKRQEKALAHAREYYNANAENIRSKRMARYYLQKEVRRTEGLREAAATRANVSPVISHSGDNKNDEAN